MLSMLFLLAAGLVKSQVNQRGVAVVQHNSIQPEGKIYGVVIGISKYKYLPQLQYASNDAVLFFNYLKKYVPLLIQAILFYILTNRQRQTKLNRSLRILLIK